MKDHHAVQAGFFTTEQALRGIQAFVTAQCGPKVVLDPDASVFAYCEAAESSHGCPLEFLEDLAEYFGLSWRSDRWVVWLRLGIDSTMLDKPQRTAAWEEWKREVAPTISVRDLAAYLARHAPAPSLEPVTVFGHTCAAAGIFCGLRALPEVSLKEIAPSTPLRSLRSSTRLHLFWRRAEWITGVKLPPINHPSFWSLRSVADGAMFAYIVLTAVFVIFATPFLLKHPQELTVALGIIISAGLVLNQFSRLVDRMHNPLPAGIATFGDLARLIARQRAVE